MIAIFDGLLDSVEPAGGAEAMVFILITNFLFITDYVFLGVVRVN